MDISGAIILPTTHANINGEKAGEAIRHLHVIVKTNCREFAGGQCLGLCLPMQECGSIPGQGAKIPHALWPKKAEHTTEAIFVIYSIKTF